MELEIAETRFKKGDSFFAVASSFLVAAIGVAVIPFLPSDQPIDPDGINRIIYLEVAILVGAVAYVWVYTKFKSTYFLDDEKIKIKRPFFSFTIRYEEIRNYYWDRGSSLRIEKLLIELIGDPHEPYEINWNRIQKEDQKNFMRIMSTGVKAAKEKREANEAVEKPSSGPIN